MPEIPYTIQELYAMPIGTDLSEFAGKVAKGSNVSGVAVSAGIGSTQLNRNS